MRTLLIFILLLTMTTWGWAARKALVIGNADYSSSPLRNPINDAQLIASTLRGLDFQVTLITDADLQRMDMALNTFITDLRLEDEAVFYYSGHGANFNGENYLIPIGRDIQEDTELKYHAFSSNLALERMQRARTTVMILDACRDNPFRGARSGSKGLSIMQGKAGSQYIIYSTEQGKTAADGSGANSPFTESFAKHIQSPERIEDVMKKVTLEVKTKTYDNQIPWTAGNLIEDFYFALASPSIEKKTSLSIQQDSNLERLVGNVRITTDFETEIFINGRSEGTAKPGYALTTGALTVGTNVIELFRDNAKYGIPITIEDNQTSALNLNLATLQKTTTPMFTIYSEPDNADLQIKGYSEYVGKTPFRIYDPVSSSYQISLSKNRYDNLNSEITTDVAKSGQIVLKLKAQFADLTVSSEPSGSSVWLNDTEIGTTPIRLDGVEQGLTPGIYTLTIKPQNMEFLSVTKEIDLKADQSYDEHVVHVRSTATINISSDYYPVKIYLDGDFLASLKQAGAVKTVFGNYVLRAEPFGEPEFPVKSFETEVVLGASETKQITLRLIPEKATLSFAANLDGYELMISDNKQSHFQGGNPAFWTGYPGTYTVQATKWGHYTIQAQLTLSEQERREQRFVFESLPKEFMKPYQSWRSHKKISLGTIALSLGLSALAYYRVDQAHKDYMAADSPGAAQTARSTFENVRNQFYGICSLNLLSAGYYTISLINGNRAKNNITQEMYSQLGRNP